MDTTPPTYLEITDDGYRVVNSPPPLVTPTLTPVVRAVPGGPARRSRVGQRISRFVFTLNNWQQEEYDWMTKEFAPATRWFIVGKETGAQGTSHLQGACILGSQWTFSKLKTLTGFKRAHVEAMRGKPEDSLAYCTKEDSNAFVFGILPTPGKRNDIHVAAERILGGATIRDLAMDAEVGAVAVVKFHKGLTILRSLTRPARTEKPIVIWLWGPTGVGKTRCAFKCGRLLCRERQLGDSSIWISSGGLRWFDGYDGQLVAIFDDFRAKHVSSFAFFLRLLDRYTTSVEFKGGFVDWQPGFIFITCPYDPATAFRTRAEHVPEDLAQLHRRIDKVVEIPSALSKSGRSELVEGVRSLVPRVDNIDSVGKGAEVQGGVDEGLP